LGGGGGGYHGGGSGCWASSSGYGAIGGGSSYIDGVTNGSTTAGVNPGQGKVIITAIPKRRNRCHTLD